LNDAATKPVGGNDPSATSGPNPCPVAGLQVGIGTITAHCRTIKVGLGGKNPNPGLSAASFTLGTYVLLEPTPEELLEPPPELPDPPPELLELELLELELLELELPPVPPVMPEAT
jgi:hypothetical protein